jgi:prepilin-type N-terminal cleavage/methylation domain-containing protein
MSSRRLGFSLTELLVVMAIISLMAGLVTRTFTASGNSSASLNTASVAMANTFDQARSEAIARNLPVQVRIVTKDANQPMNAGRIFSLWAPQRDANGLVVYDANGNQVYERISAWQQLPQGVSVIGGGATWFDAAAVNRTGLNAFDSASAAQNVVADPMTYQGRAVAEAMAVEFKPDGGLRSPQSDNNSYHYLLLARVNGQNPDVAARASEVVGENLKTWRQVRISKLTGQSRVNAL